MSAPGGISTIENTAERPGRPLISIVIPCYRERDNLPVLYERMNVALASADFDWELILIDDHSPDDTFAVASGLTEQDKRVRVFRLARNCGSHLASACGLELTRGQAAIVMAADLQDPPELIREMVARWRNGDQVVWAIREESAHQGFAARLASCTYWAMLASMLPQSTLPMQGADFVLLDRVAIDALGQCRELNFNILGIVVWLGFRQVSVRYKKEERLHGKSSWTFRKKIRQVIDSLTSFSHAPLRLISLAGVVIAFFGFLFAVNVIVNYFVHGISVVGWPSLMVAILVLSGLQMIMLGIIGEYLWRTLDESRRRPRYVIERSTEQNRDTRNTR
jgi:polyisoprenyl-phosphate glycosyltransferase